MMIYTFYRKRARLSHSFGRLVFMKSHPLPRFLGGRFDGHPDHVLPTSSIHLFSSFPLSCGDVMLCLFTECTRGRQHHWGSHRLAFQQTNKNFASFVLAVAALNLAAILGWTEGWFLKAWIAHGGATARTSHIEKSSQILISLWNLQTFSAIFV